jgi:hypothetical protein
MGFLPEGQQAFFLYQIVVLVALWEGTTPSGEIFNLKFTNLQKLN